MARSESLVGIWGKASKMKERSCHLNTYFDIKGFIIDLRVGRFSSLLAEMILKYLGYTTQPNQNTEVLDAPGHALQFTTRNLWGKHAPRPCFTCINGTGATQLTQFRMKWRQRPTLKLRCHLFLQTQIYGCPCITWLHWTAHRAIDAFKNGMAPSTR